MKITMKPEAIIKISPLCSCGHMVKVLMMTTLALQYLVIQNRKESFFPLFDKIHDFKMV